MTGDRCHASTIPVLPRLPGRPPCAPAPRGPTPTLVPIPTHNSSSADSLSLCFAGGSAHPFGGGSSSGFGGSSFGGSTSPFGGGGNSGFGGSAFGSSTSPFGGGGSSLFGDSSANPFAGGNSGFNFGSSAGATSGFSFGSGSGGGGLGSGSLFAGGGSSSGFSFGSSGSGSLFAGGGSSSGFNFVDSGSGFGGGGFSFADSNSGFAGTAKGFDSKSTSPKFASRSADFELIGSQAFHDTVQAMDWTPGGDMLVAGTWAGELTLFGGDDLAEFGSLVPIAPICSTQRIPVLGVAFNPVSSSRTWHWHYPAHPDIP